jgi:hypothetical protein
MLASCADRVAQQLRVLYDGAMVSAHLDTDSTAVAAARAMAEVMLDQAIGRRHRNTGAKRRR